MELSSVPCYDCLMTFYNDVVFNVFLCFINIIVVNNWLIKG